MKSSPITSAAWRSLRVPTGETVKSTETVALKGGAKGGGSGEGGGQGGEGGDGGGGGGGGCLGDEGGEGGGVGGQLPEPQLEP